jgi:hypothetical protein
MVIGRLRDYFINSADQLIKKGLVTREDLAFAVQDYMGMDEDPFQFKKALL